MKMKHGWLCCGLLVAALVVAMTMTSSAQSPGSVTPYGDGSVANPYQISEPGHLVWMGDHVGSSSGMYYMVQNDMDASVTTNWNSGAGLAPIGTNPSAPFMGTFNGNGNVISNLCIVRPSENYVGLFGCVGSNGVVKNLGLVWGAVTGASYIGSLVGWNSGGTVSGCYATGSVSGGSYTGGLVGYNEGGTVFGCHTMGPVTGSAGYVAGLVSWNEGGTVSDCYTTGPVTDLGYHNIAAGLVGANHGMVRNCYASGSVNAPAGYYVGCIVGANQAGGTVSDCYATGSVTGSTYVACLVGYNDGLVGACYSTGPVTGSSSVGGLVGLNNLGTVSNCYWDTQNSGQAASAGGTGTNTAAMKQQTTFVGWDFINVWHMTENLTYPFFTFAAVEPPGAGTAGDPYLISQLGNLVWMGDHVGSSGGKHYTLQNDLDASATTNWNSGAGFAPIGIGDQYGQPLRPFMGVFDGNGKAISHLSITRPAQGGVGLFGYMGSSGVVKNLGLTGGAVSGYYYVGSLVGLNNDGMVSNCYATCPVTGSSTVGGLMGCNGSYGHVGTVSGCHATGPVTGDGSVGGLVGANYFGDVIRCFATGSVTGTGNQVGGLMGYNEGTVSRCYASGPALGVFYIGGLVGYNQELATVSDSYARGSATAENAVGGLVGYNYGGTMSRCYATGSATSAGWPWVGGILGWWWGSIGVIDSYWDVQTSGLANSAGGTGTNTAAMMQQATFAGWDFTNVWSITENVTYPFFRAATVTPPGAGTSGDPFQISELGNLVWMGDNVSSSSGKHYTVQNDIDASATAGWESGAGFAPIGNDGTPFMGLFNGNGHALSSLTINRPGQNYVGLFGFVGNGGVVKDLGLAEGAVKGLNYVGSLVGYNTYGTLSGCYVTGPVTGNFFIGGLVGFNQYGAVSGCHAEGAVTGNSMVGGLVGENAYGTVSGCYATGTVNGGNYAGGLVGGNEHNVGAVSNCYATGSVMGTNYVGGLMGLNYSPVSGCYATGWVMGLGNVGGLVGYSLATVDHSYWDVQTSGLANSAGGTGTNTAAMMQQATFTGWDFINVWEITENVTYPWLAPLVTPTTKLIGVSGNLAFGTVTTGQTATATMTITNGGAATLTVTGITYPAGFSGVWSGTIAAGGTQAVTVTFAPVAVTIYSGTVTVNSDATGGTNMLAASGSGQAVAMLTVQANPTNAGSVTGGGVYIVGSNATLTATASNGWLFASWNDGAIANPRTISMPPNAVTCTATFVSAPMSLTLGNALNATGLVWQTGGNANWAVQTATTHDGVAALRSGAIGAGQQTWFQTTTNGPGSLLFWWKVSSAPTNYLQFYVNTQLVSQISGNVGWNQIVTFLGTSNQVTLKWVYAKNTAAVSGSDAGWVDQVTWIPCPYAEHVPQMFYQDPSGLLASWVLDSTGGFRFARVLANTGGWALKAAGDVDGDGVSDLLFQDAASNTGGWFMNPDGSVRDARFWFNIGPWEIKACGDYEGIGRGQLFFQTAAGQTAYWRLDTNGIFQASVPLGNMGGWKLRGAGDLDGDHKAELFWQNAAGVVAIWYHNPDDSIHGAVMFSTGPWALCGVVDIDGDGVSDLLWQTPDDLVGGWFMNSNSIPRSANFWWNTGAWKLKAAGR